MGQCAQCPLVLQNVISKIIRPTRRPKGWLPSQHISTAKRKGNAATVLGTLTRGFYFTRLIQSQFFFLSITACRFESFCFWINKIIINRQPVVIKKPNAGNVVQYSVTDRSRSREFQQRQGASLYQKQRDVAVAGTEERK